MNNGSLLKIKGWIIPSKLKWLRSLESGSGTEMPFRIKGLKLCVTNLGHTPHTHLLWKFIDMYANNVFFLYLFTGISLSYREFWLEIKNLTKWLWRAYYSEAKKFANQVALLTTLALCQWKAYSSRMKITSLR